MKLKTFKTRFARDYEVRYGNTLTSTFWRFVEEAQEHAMVGLVTEHPHRPSENFDPLNPCKHFIRSARFRSQFRHVGEAHLFEQISRYCGRQRGGMLGAAEVQLVDDNGDRHLFDFQSFSNSYEVLTLGVQKTRHRAGIAV